MLGVSSSQEGEEMMRQEGDTVGRVRRKNIPLRAAGRHDILPGIVFRIDHCSCRTVVNNGVILGKGGLAWGGLVKGSDRGLKEGDGVGGEEGEGMMTEGGEERDGDGHSREGDNLDHHHHHHDKDGNICINSANFNGTSPNAKSNYIWNTSRRFSESQLDNGPLRAQPSRRAAPSSERINSNNNNNTSSSSNSISTALSSINLAGGSLHRPRSYSMTVEALRMSNVEEGANYDGHVTHDLDTDPSLSLHAKPNGRRSSVSGALVGSPTGYSGALAHLVPNRFLQTTSRRISTHGSSPGCACSSCGSTITPYWRDGWSSSVMLCNACGLRFQKFARRCPSCMYIPRKEDSLGDLCIKCGTPWVVGAL